MSGARLGPQEIARRLAGRIEQLAPDLLPAGHREGHEWRCGNITGDPGDSFGVHLTGQKAGVWGDFAGEQRGDALDLVCAVLGLRMGEAMRWSLRWLGMEQSEADREKRPKERAARPDRARIEPARFPDNCRKAWKTARPIIGTNAEIYFAARGLRFTDPQGAVLRYADRHPRRNAAGDLEHHPALLALLSDIRTGEPSGLINIYLLADGIDRLRDPKGKTSWGRVGGGAVMLSPFDDVTMGLVTCEGVETGSSLLLSDLAPVWCCGGAGNLAAFPVLDGIEALTIAADADKPGQKAAESAKARWRDAGREAVIIAPPVGDWADGRR